MLQFRPQSLRQPCLPLPVHLLQYLRGRGASTATICAFMAAAVKNLDVLTVSSMARRTGVLRDGAPRKFQQSWSDAYGGIHIRTTIALRAGQCRQRHNSESCNHSTAEFDFALFSDWASALLAVCFDRT